MQETSLYGAELPAFLRPYIEAPAFERLKHIGMNCGCEYTAFPRFTGIPTYTRFSHSIGVALIIWRFTQDPKMSIAGLLHDIATPVFAHVVDFLHGDHETQTFTEGRTRRIIEASAAFACALRAQHLTTDDVCDYHLYPIADNDTPRLSADRLEYTLRNAQGYGFIDKRTARAYYADLIVHPNEDGAPELCFRSRETAKAFTLTALRCARVYVSDEDRYSMQALADILRMAIDMRILTEEDLYTTEPIVIEKLLRDAHCARAWARYRAMRRMITQRSTPLGEGWLRVSAKKRYIDPLVAGAGRVSALEPACRFALTAFLQKDFSYWLYAE